MLPTRDRPDQLNRCLEALGAQTEVDRVEVVVVDDGSTAADAVAAVVARHPCARLIRRAGGGPAAARNSGARSARGSFLCFTDDDCVPRPDWVERLVESLTQGADAAAGATLSRGGALAEASELVAHAPAAAHPRGESDLAFAPSNNLACTKTVFETMLFDESYPDAAGEDRDWCERLTAAGYVLRFQPEACVAHHQELTFRRFLRQQIRYGQGAFRFRRRGGERRPFEPAAFYTALVRGAFARSFTVGLLVCVAQAATAAGFIRGWARHQLSSGSIMAARSSGSSPSRRDGS